MIITYPKWRCLHFIVCLDTSWAIIQMRRDCVFYFARVQLVSVWRADELMKIDSNYVEPRLTARNDGEGSRILMRRCSTVRAHRDVTPQIPYVLHTK
jgi:hypothetical protein